jgi:hypothetical protein
MAADARPYRIGYHIRPFDEQGNFLPEGGMFGDMDVYADTTPADGSPEEQAKALAKAHEIAQRFLEDPRAAVVLIHESHQPTPSSCWQGGPGVARVKRPAVSDKLERSEGFRNPYAGRMLPVRWPVPVTKWDLLGDADRESVERQTITADGMPVPCTLCEADLVTEADFARHFTIPDLRYWNLGDCPRA